jgi:hypothetical protein
MILIVPYRDEMLPSDARMLRLAEFLGIQCRKLPLPQRVDDFAAYFQEVIPPEPACLLVNPEVMKEWIGGDSVPRDLVSVFLSRFSSLIVHGLRPNAIDTDIVAALSRGRLERVQEVGEDNLNYEISKGCEDICGTFSGLSFGPVNRANDHVLLVSKNDHTVRELILINRNPFLVLIEESAAQIFFLGSEDVADLTAEAKSTRLVECFSKLVPQTMALRHVFGDACWQPSNQQASVIIDDPLLRKQYGFLNYESLLSFVKRYDFHVTIAFIPHNFRRSSPRVIQLFRENPEHLSICFHGNDHTGAEFASTDDAFLNTSLHTADGRMNAHFRLTGLACDRVMVFPQGRFSTGAMAALQANNFLAAVNSTPYPMTEEVRLTISELIEPAVMRYGGFPLFVRHSIEESEKQDIAFKIFFGQPILICEHHDVGQRLESLAALASRIRAVAPTLQWSNLSVALSNSTLRRRGVDGKHHVRAYSNVVRVNNGSEAVEDFVIEWISSGRRRSIEEVLWNGMPCDSVTVEEGNVRIVVKLEPRRSYTFSLVHRNDLATQGALDFRRIAKAFLRRRLSEVRDNYLSKHPHLLAVAKNVQRRISSA